MKLGFVSAIFAEPSLDDVFAFAAAEGFAGVEIMSRPVGKTLDGRKRALRVARNVLAPFLPL
jgi:sugar phosphate isomerase/epimerase